MSGEVLQNSTDSPLTKKQEDAARLVAEDAQTDQSIADSLGIHRDTLEKWKRRQEFAVRVQQHKEAFKDRALSEGFADKRARIAALNGSAQDIMRWLAENEYEREEVKVAANGEHVSYKMFDQARYAQFRGALDDIAKEMGDRKTVAELTGKDGEALVLGLVGVDIGKV
jgi:DNA-binding CsgD family transcriptional regulator